MAEALSQAEIDALLSGEAMPEPAPAGSMITPEEEDASKSFSELVVSSGGGVLSTLMGQDATIELVEITETDPNTVASQIKGDVVVSEVDLKGFIQGKSLVVVSLDNAMLLAMQMTGGGGESEFGDLEESAFSEAVQSIFGAVKTQLANKTGGDISLEPIEVTTKPEDLGEMLPASTERLILVEYQISSGELQGAMYHVLPRNLIQSLISASSGKVAPKEDEDKRSFGSSAKAPGVMSAPPQFGGGGAFGGLAGMMGGGDAPQVDLTNLELILDISVEVKVELGRTKRKIKDVLELGPGSVVELEKLAGEPVDILVNDKLFAKGEVVVIDENFGVRITDILSIQERIEALK